MNANYTLAIYQDVLKKLKNIWEGMIITSCLVPYHFGKIKLGIRFFKILLFSPKIVPDKVTIPNKTDCMYCQSLSRHFQYFKVNFHTWIKSLMIFYTLMLDYYYRNVIQNERNYAKKRVCFFTISVMLICYVRLSDPMVQNINLFMQIKYHLHSPSDYFVLQF